ncbi:MAG: transcription elongation factor GreA [Thermoflexales bacterium]|nr:transcription elongation factor GreA [Thermoflexales bacterium]MDW8352683.1 transcription elongation factor GreA [Anaerolineae bacterium]
MTSPHDSNKIYLTREGAQKLRDELAYLRDVKRPELAERLRFAIQQGDLSENADYTAAKEEQGFLEGRILALERMLADCIILDETESDQGEVRMGSRVTVIEDGFDDQETFQIVGVAEADPMNGKISNVSPLGQALIGKRVGAKVRVVTPAGVTVFKILAIE